MRTDAVLIAETVTAAELNHAGRRIVRRALAGGHPVPTPAELARERVPFIPDWIREADVSKVCPHCAERKPLERFAAAPRYTSGRASWCRDCTNALKRARRD